MDKWQIDAVLFLNLLTLGCVAQNNPVLYLLLTDERKDIFICPLTFRRTDIFVNPGKVKTVQGPTAQPFSLVNLKIDINLNSNTWKCEHSAYKRASSFPVSFGAIY